MTNVDTRAEIKAGIQALINKYETARERGSIKGYTEEETKKDFILPLFSLLSWEVENKAEVSAEESQRSGGRVDYGFYINGRVTLFG